jgi:hypothetical protein
MTDEAKQVQRPLQEAEAVPEKHTDIEVRDRVGLLTQTEDDEMFGESSIDTTTGLSFNRVKIVRETAQFDLGNDEYPKTLTGHILFKHRASQWWEVPYDERAEGDDPRPQCYSINGVCPHGGDKVRADLCSSCELDKFGSAPGDDKKGKACRNTLRMLFLQDNTVLPVIITAPPTSLGPKGPLQNWLNSVPNDVSKAYNAIGKKTAKGGPIVDYHWAHVELSLDKVTFSSGDAAVLCVKTLDVITPESDLAGIRQLFKMKQAATKAYQNELTQYMETESGGEHDIEDTANVEQCDDEVPI